MMNAGPPQDLADARNFPQRLWPSNARSHCWPSSIQRLARCRERSFAQRRARRFPATGVNFPLFEIRAPRSVDQTNDLGLPQKPRGRGLNLSAR